MPPTVPEKLNELRTMVKWLGFTHVWIALGAMSAAWASFVSLQTQLPEGFSKTHALHWSLGIGAATGWIYTAQRLIKLKRNPDGVPAERAEFLRQWGGGLLGAWSAIILGWWGWTPIAIDEVAQLIAQASGPVFLLAALSAGYASIPFVDARGWRELPKWKLPVISLSWALATVWVPFEVIGMELPWDPAAVWSVGGSHFMAQFLFVAGLTLPFDIRDLQIDPAELQTIPQRRGADRAILISMVLMVLGCLGFGLIDTGVERVIAGLCAVLLVWSTRNQKTEWVYTLGLDGCLVLQGALTFFMWSIV